MDFEKIQKQIPGGEAFFISDPANVRYLSGFSGSNGQMFITRKNAWLITDFRYLRVAKTVLPKKMRLVIQRLSIGEEVRKLAKKQKIKIVLFESNHLSFLRYEALKKSLKPVQLKPGRGMVEPHRMIKTAQELRLIIKAQRLAEETFLNVVKNLKPGKTEEQIAWEIERIGYELGADSVSFPSIVGFGKNSGSPHHQNTNKKLKKGDIVLIDMGMKYKGYCSDMTRMVFTSQPTPLQAKIYNTVLEAQEAAIKKLHAGMKGDTADGIARNIIKKAGYGKTFGHSLGHGIGLEVHEAPNLSSGYSHAIPENTVVTVEPGIYLENSFGVRIEDMVLVKGNNVINLTKIAKDLKSCIYAL